MFSRASPLKPHGNESNDHRSDLSPTQNEFIDADLGLASPTALSQSQYIQFPQDANSITSCGRAVAHFRAIFLKISQSTVGWWNSDSETQYYNKAEAETIRDAHSLASACASLFNDISNAAVCGTSHRAKLHLSGFRKEHVTMMLGTCQENRWISSSFTRSDPAVFSPVFDANNVD
jgi:hypothetical protein